jgi:hypothetical protein
MVYTIHKFTVPPRFLIVNYCQSFASQALRLIGPVRSSPCQIQSVPDPQMAGLITLISHYVVYSLDQKRMVLPAKHGRDNGGLSWKTSGKNQIRLTLIQ